MKKGKFLSQILGLLTLLIVFALWYYVIPFYIQGNTKRQDESFLPAFLIGIIFGALVSRFSAKIFIKKEDTQNQNMPNPNP